MSAPDLRASPARSGRRARALSPLEGASEPSFGGALAQSFRTALASLAGHKLRAALTTFAIVVGVGGVLVVSAFGQLESLVLGGAAAQVGANLVNAETVGPPVGGAGSAASRPLFSDADVQAVRHQVPHVVAVSPRRLAPVQLVAGGRNWKTQLVAVYPDYQIVWSLATTSGAFFTAQDEASGAAVAVIGPTVAAQIFPGANPVGQTARIENVDFQVVGLLAARGSSGVADLDDSVLVPYSAYKQRLNGGDFGAMNLLVDQPQNVAAVVPAVTKVLAQSRNLPEGAPPDFRVSSFSQAAGAARREAATISLALELIAAIALLIGGLGVANIMLLAVSERTREIGVRLAVGARPRDLLLQFVLEATTVAVIGGLIGILAGLGLSLAATAYLAQFLRGPVLLPSPGAMILALAASVLTGVAFGYYPALRAARLNPIDALRHA